MKNIILSSLLACFIFSCDNRTYTRNQNNIIISANSELNRSSTAGNLMTTALQQENALDIVLYPKQLMRKNQSILYKEKLSDTEINTLLSIYPEGVMDQFYIGTMTGKTIKELLFERTIEVFSAELEVSGLRYYFMFDGGIPISQTVTDIKGKPLDDNKIFRVAISKFFHFSGETFPSYKYRNSIDRKFQNSFTEISARDSLRRFLSRKKNLNIPNLTYQRALVEKTPAKKISGVLKISEVQGDGHLSKYRGDIVTVEAVITAAAALEWYPGGFEYYLQEEETDWDNNPATSEAIQLYLDAPLSIFEVGDKVRVTGTVFEEATNSGMSKTQIRDLHSYKIVEKNVKLPRPIRLGQQGRKIPKKHISTYHGNLNYKDHLNLNDGIDFWESLEGMQIIVNNPKIVGFRGGKESSNPFDQKDYLTLYVLPDGDYIDKNLTAGGGIQPIPSKESWNPNILTVASGNLSRGLDTERVYQVGELIEGPVEGILQYGKNIFGDGEYSLVVPRPTEAIENFNQQNVSNMSSDCLDPTTGVVLLKCRPQSSFSSDENSLTIAAYNLKNLAGNEPTRIEATGEMISENLKCPDIISLVEVQDDNGLDFSGSSSAKVTLNKIIDTIDCPKKSYQAMSINPKLHNEGGQPGGNIQVAIIYDQNKLFFEPRHNPAALAETTVLSDGSLSNNPGRVYPNDPAFKNTRKSLVAQFYFKNEPIYILVNHFNSKLGDASHWGPVQPVMRRSEIKRAKLAQKINHFVSLIERRSPKANIAVMGDFNAYLNEGPMKVLEGNLLYNLMRTLPQNKRYTTNHNGNSQSIDYIFVNRRLRQSSPSFEVLHLNSDYMGRLSDHDPVLGRFVFN
jgi:endonuclease/exonuclease/phosphatase family metal-dependent hydrolase